MIAEELLCGINLFNTGHFFECHDVLEDLWHGPRGTDRLFLQGLIQLAVGMYHFENRNWKGANSQLKKSAAKLEAYLPHHCGVDIGRLLAESAPWIGRSEPGVEGKCNDGENSIIPKIHLFHLASSKEN
jgi:predicted metal-dependent hydrolase